MAKIKPFPNLRAELRRNGMTYEDLGNEIGIAHITVLHKMNGQTDWTISEIEKICEYFNKNYYELFK